MNPSPHTVRFYHHIFLACVVFTMVALPLRSTAANAVILEVPPTKGMDRAELAYLRPDKTPRAVLVLCPGENQDGKELVESELWQKFASQNDLGLVGVSFSSSQEANRKGIGYFAASNGSGQILLDGVRTIFGKELPLLIYGFSGGAHFASSFENWRPGNVIAWCVYSASWWVPPLDSETNPPGIVACGEDDPRLGASLGYFKQGRALGKPWLWIAPNATGHALSLPLDEFVRHYFATILDQTGKDSFFVDIDFATEATTESVKKTPSLTAELPSKNLFDEWKGIHSP